MLMNCTLKMVKMVYFILHMVLMPSDSVVSDSATPQTVAHQAPLSMGFSRQECWSEKPLLLPGDLPGLGTEPMSPASPVLAGEFFATEPLGSHMTYFFTIKKYIYLLSVGHTQDTGILCQGAQES